MFTYLAYQEGQFSYFEEVALYAQPALCSLMRLSRVSLGDAVRTSRDNMNRCVVCEPSDLLADVFYTMVKLVLNSDKSDKCFLLERHAVVLF